MSSMESQRQPPAAWNTADAYESYVGRWSRLVALDFLAWLALPAGSRWLDVGCGTGALSQTILDQAQPAAVLGIDSSDHFIAYAREQIDDPRASFIVGDARTLPVADAAFDAVVSGLVLNFVPPNQRTEAVVEMRRAIRPGGIAAIYVWDYAEGMQLMRSFWDTAATLDPTAGDRDEGRRFSFCQPDPLGALFRRSGFDNVDVRAIDVPTVFRSFDDYWEPFLGGQGTAPGYVMSLSEEQRVALRERLRARLPVDTDGSIHLTARAWAVRGHRDAH